MSARQSAAVDRALARIRNGQTAYSAAKDEGVSLSAIYRAIQRNNPGREDLERVRRAAPLLLEALKLCAETLMTRGMPTQPQMLDAARIAREAIAKATGK